MTRIQTRCRVTLHTLDHRTPEDQSLDLLGGPAGVAGPPPSVSEAGHDHIPLPAQDHTRGPPPLPVDEVEVIQPRSALLGDRSVAQMTVFHVPLHLAVIAVHHTVLIIDPHRHLQDGVELPAQCLLPRLHEAEPGEVLVKTVADQCPREETVLRLVRAHGA
jgi:hypothetical protein